MTARISTTDTAKLVRAKLIEVFGKTTKFSVTSRTSAITVRWTDGPTDKEVDKHIGHFRAGDFDSMEDLYKYSNSPYANQYIFTDRHISEDVWVEVSGIMTEQFPQILTEGWFDFVAGTWIASKPSREQVDWNRLYRKAVWNYDAQTRQFIVTDFLNGSTPDNWQHHTS